MKVSLNPLPSALLESLRSIGYTLDTALADLLDNSTLNSLRNQTQERIDADFIGWCTREKKPVGAYAFGGQRRPVCFTTSLEDFKKHTANSIAMDLAALNEPVVLIIKKNKSTLENLSEWLKENNRHNLQNFPMLLIDDEADYASINTKKEEDSPAAINMAIRKLLSLFTRTSFVGYTATPFANIFIDPESEDEMENGSLYKDLFPRDFILSLDPPDNYVGPHRLFVDGADLDCVRDIEDNEHHLPIRHKIEFEPKALPDSLQRAICCFIIGKALRLLRGQAGKCHSMMVNASRFTRVQNILGNLVLDHLKQLKQNIGNYAALPPDTALQNKDLAFIKSVFEEEFATAGFRWSDIQKSLKESVDPMEVLIVNSSSPDTLDYSTRNYPNGRSVIAIGGLGLSRGLTLEGLITSYFLRNSVMYDTLMQMGRWFGYRDDYADVCRIFMTPSDYKHTQKGLAADAWSFDPALSKLTIFLGDLVRAAKRIGSRLTRGAPFLDERVKPEVYARWYVDEKLKGVCNHETRTHIRADLQRYFFAAVFGQHFRRSPVLEEFPAALLPDHENVKDALIENKFNDRFRVQVAGKPSTTVVSHIAKDGHYYIHYDPSQCRSLTVREAARLQTFPDNYFFEGPRTEQYHQVGNAVPPLLAHQIAKIVVRLFD